MLERSWLLHACLLLCSLALVGLLASPVGLFASLFLFDAPGSALGWTALAYSSVVLFAVAFLLLETLCGGKFQC
jgi:hypothetical protein